jgi:hypothetical protein
MSAPGAAAAAASPAAASPAAASPEAAALAAALLSVTQPTLRTATQTLVELQESQHVLACAIGAKRAELLEGSLEWQRARAALDRLPEYLEKAARVRRLQAATAALAERLDKGAAALAARVEERERERAEKRGADAAGFAAVAQR